MTITDSHPAKNPNSHETAALFQKCRDNAWDDVLHMLQTNPPLALKHIAMDNSVTTTVLHQAIVSKGNDVNQRAGVIKLILQQTPTAAQLRNGNGSLALHVIAQRNTKLTSCLKEQLMELLIAAHPAALLVAGGVGRRTPLHISFTNYMSPELTKLMIQAGPQACFMVDKKGYLAAHIACSRHCSPTKLQMLLNVNPAALYQPTFAGQTLLSLAVSTATAAHPNHCLIDYLHGLLSKQQNSPVPSMTVSTNSALLPETHYPCKRRVPIPIKSRKRRPILKQEEPESSWMNCARLFPEDPAPEIYSSWMTSAPLYKEDPTPETHSSWMKRARVLLEDPTPDTSWMKSARVLPEDPADLLLHFSRNNRDTDCEAVLTVAV